MKCYGNDGYQGNLVAATCSTSAIFYLFGVGIWEGTVWKAHSYNCTQHQSEYGCSDYLKHSVYSSEIHLAVAKSFKIILAMFSKYSS